MKKNQNMPQKLTLALLTILTTLHSITASPYPTTPPYPLYPRSDCTNTDPEGFYDASCWATLDLTNWLKNWKAPAICNSTDLGIGCCGSNEEWSTCFLRLGKADSGLNCSQISVNTNDCAYNSALAPGLDPSIKAQVRFVLRTIFSRWYLS